MVAQGTKLLRGQRNSSGWLCSGQWKASVQADRRQIGIDGAEDKQGEWKPCGYQLMDTCHVPAAPPVFLPERQVCGAYSQMPILLRFA